MDTKNNLITLIATLILMLFCFIEAHAQSGKIKIIKTYSNYVDSVNGIENLRRPGSSECFLFYCQIDSFDINSKLQKTTSLNWNEDTVSVNVIHYDDKDNIIQNDFLGIPQMTRFIYDSIIPTKIKYSEVYFGNELQHKSSYNEKNVVIETITYRDGKEWMKSIYIYDSISNQKIQTQCFFNGKLSRNIEYVYDSKNRITEELYYDNDTLNFIMKSEYYSNIKTKYSNFHKGEIVPEESWEYDNYGNLIKHTFNYKYTEVFSYKYDKNWNWIECHGGKPLLKRTKIIEYY